jgi:hypothetical protein
VLNDSDESVCEALKRLKPDYFANGGDRKNHNTPEMQVCKELGIELLWNMGGGKIQSSSDLVNDSPMLVKTPTRYDDVEIVPSRVAILQSGDVPKK